MAQPAGCTHVDAFRRGPARAMIWCRALIIKEEFQFSLEEHHRFAESWITPCKTASRVPLRCGRGMGLAASGRTSPRACEFPESRSRRSIAGAGAIWRSRTPRFAGRGSAGGKLWTGMDRRPELAPFRKRARSCRSCAQGSALAAIFEARSSGKIEGARRRHPHPIRDHRRKRSHPPCCRLHARLRVRPPRRSRPLRRRNRAAAAPGGGAGNQAGDDTRLDGRRCSGRHRRSRRS